MTQASAQQDSHQPGRHPTRSHQPDRLPTLSAEEAIPALLDEHGGKLFGLGLRLCGSREDAEELVQEIFMTAFRKWDQFEGRSEPTTWLYTIASRACTRKHRKRAGEPATTQSLEELIPTDDSTVPALTSVAESPYERSVRHEVQEQVEKALHEVPQDFRMALILKDIAELSLAEVATALGIKEATAKTRVHRARLALRKAIADALPQRAVRDPAAPPVCRDLLLAKLDALDRGVDFPLAPDLLSDRCESFFRTLDLTRDACRRIGEGEIPPDVRSRVEAALRGPQV